MTPSVDEPAATQSAEELAQWWPLPDRDDLCEALQAAYADPDRVYHDATHLAEVFERLVDLAPTVPFDRDAVSLAAWFHDAVYRGQPGDEELAAEWAAEALLGHPDRDEVVRLVRMTGTHDPDEDDLNACALSDADLAILAAPRDRYEEYVASVRQEYAHVDDADFAEGRAALLRDLLDKPTLFHCPQARQSWENTARENVKRELDDLDARRR